MVHNRIHQNIPGGLPAQARQCAWHTAVHDCPQPDGAHRTHPVIAHPVIANDHSYATMRGTPGYETKQHIVPSRTAQSLTLAWKSSISCRHGGTTANCAVKHPVPPAERPQASPSGMTRRPVCPSRPARPSRPVRSGASPFLAPQPFGGTSACIPARFRRSGPRAAPSLPCDTATRHAAHRSAARPAC
ncbi:hypothetical protein DSECCO2_528990 [anaerobic digester metagenome]